jgi:hypothetical protein
LIRGDAQRRMTEAEGSARAVGSDIRSASQRSPGRSNAIQSNKPPSRSEAGAARAKQPQLRRASLGSPLLREFTRLLVPPSNGSTSKSTMRPITLVDNSELGSSSRPKVEPGREHSSPRFATHCWRQAHSINQSMREPRAFPSPPTRTTPSAIW